MWKSEPIAGVRSRPEEAAAAYRVRIARKDYVGADGTVLPVLRDFELELPRHAFTCLIGPSGCGKTTALRLLLRLDRDFDGAIDPRLAAERTAAVFQEPRLLPWRTVAQNLRLALPPAAAARDLAPLLEAVGLAGFADRYPAELSLGMARRAALARAFAVAPGLLLLDEPFVSLDEATANRLRDLLLDLWRADPVTVLMVTHNIREAVRLADQVVILSERPARVLATVPLERPREARDSRAVQAVIAELALRFPRFITA